MEDIEIVIATHKEYKMPHYSIYKPIHVGAVNSSEKLPFIKDNTGDNISDKNSNFCELTALYWLWKNSQSEYKGLVHYRRHFSRKKWQNIFVKGRFDNILDSNTLEKKLEEYDILLPKKRKYYIETIGSHYKNTHYEEDLIVTKEVLKNIYPDYVDTFEEVLNRRSAHMFNMLIMSSSYYDEYCEWLFKILLDVEKKLDISEYSTFHSRVFGRISEILLDVWIIKNKLDYAEIPIMFMENQNWFYKISKFLKAKLLGEKY